MRVVQLLGIAALGTLCAPIHGQESIPDLSGGDWVWSSLERLRMPRDFVETMGPILGIVPEGENTHALCESVGTMTLFQSGSELDGYAVRTFNACETSGGQVFRQLSRELQVTDGQATAHTVYFSFESALVRPCPHQIVVTDVVGGKATGMAGTGWCILPGHPQSESPVQLSPPSGGTSKTLSWEASR